MSNTAMAEMPYAQYVRMNSNEEELFRLLERLKEDPRTKDVVSYTKDEYGRVHFEINKNEDYMDYNISCECKNNEQDEIWEKE